MGAVASPPGAARRTAPALAAGHAVNRSSTRSLTAPTHARRALSPRVRRGRQSLAPTCIAPEGSQHLFPGGQWDEAGSREGSGVERGRGGWAPSSSRRASHCSHGELPSAVRVRMGKLAEGTRV